MSTKKHAAPLTESQEVDLEIVLPKVNDVFTEILTYIPTEHKGNLSSKTCENKPFYLNYFLDHCFKLTNELYIKYILIFYNLMILNKERRKSTKKEKI